MTRKQVLYLQRMGLYDADEEENDVNVNNFYSLFNDSDNDDNVTGHTSEIETNDDVHAYKQLTETKEHGNNHNSGLLHVNFN